MSRDQAPWVELALQPPGVDGISWEIHHFCPWIFLAMGAEGWVAKHITTGSIHLYTIYTRVLWNNGMGVLNNGETIVSNTRINGIRTRSRRMDLKFSEKQSSTTFVSHSHSLQQFLKCNSPTCSTNLLNKTVCSLPSWQAQKTGSTQDVITRTRTGSSES